MASSGTVISPPKSHLTRGAWIEIYAFPPRFHCFQRRTSHEVRGLKYQYYRVDGDKTGRTSHEVRGLKSDVGERHDAC